MRKSVGRANVATVFFEKLLVLLEVFEKLKFFSLVLVSIFKKINVLIFLKKYSYIYGVVRVRCLFCVG
jgi:hypothetical protein